MLEQEILKYTFLSRRISAIFSLVILAFAALIFSNTYPDYQRFGSAPVQLTISQAIAGFEKTPWVTLTDARWQCEQYIEPLRRNSTFIRLSDATDQNIVIADYSGAINCLDKKLSPPTGTFKRIHQKTLGLLRKSGLKVTQEQIIEDQIYYMCMYCGRGNSQLGVIMSGVFFIMSFLFYAITEKAREQSKSPDPFTAKPSDILATGIFFFLLGAIAICFLQGRLFIFIPFYIIGLLMCGGGLTIASFYKNKAVLDYFTKTNYEFMISVWGKDYFVNRTHKCKQCGKENRFDRSHCLNCKTKL